MNVSTLKIRTETLMWGFMKEISVKNSERLLLLIVVTVIDMCYRLGCFLNCWLQVQSNAEVLWGHNIVVF